MGLYKTYAPATDFKVAFKTTPITTGILSDATKNLRFSYFDLNNPATPAVDITGTAAEINGTYITPDINILAEGDYVVVCEYTADDTIGSPVWVKMAESQVSVGVVTGGAVPVGLTFGAIL